MGWLNERRTRSAQGRKTIGPSQATDIADEEQARAFSAPATSYTADEEISPEAVRLREFLRDVLLADYGIVTSADARYPHDEFFHYAAVLYDRFNLGRAAKRSTHEPLASRVMNLSRSSSHLILARHIHGPASELSIGEISIETTLIRYLHFADPVKRTYTSSIPGSCTEKACNKPKQSSRGLEHAHTLQANEALRKKLVLDKSELVPAVFQEQSMRDSFEEAIKRLIIQHFPRSHPLRQKIEAEAETAERAKMIEQQEDDSEAEHKSAAEVRVDTPEYVRWLNWFSRTSKKS